MIPLVAIVAPAQVSITKIKNFGDLANATGLAPDTPLVQAVDGMLYGTTSQEDGIVTGTLFKLQPDGSGFTIVKSFTNATEGIYPVGQLAISGDTIYGTTGRPYDTSAKVYKVNTDGSGYTVLKDIAFPWAGVVLSGDTLYGWGFKIQTDGTGYTELAGFPWVETYGESIGLIVSGNELYGTTMVDGLYGAGTVFKVNTNGAAYTVLFDIPVGDMHSVQLALADGALYGAIGGNMVKINTDGTGSTVLKEGASIGGEFVNPGLTRSGGVLYGSMVSTMISNYVAGVFAMNTDGTGYRVIRSFTESDGVGNFPWGSFPWWTASENRLYAVSAGYGTISSLNTDGSGFQVLKEFTPSEVAAHPGPLAYSSGTLYGSAGVIFKVNTDGTGYTVLRQLATSERLAVTGNTLYGIVGGWVFKMNTDGTGYVVLKDLASSADGGLGVGLARAGDTLYGALSGNPNPPDKVFKLNTDGTGYAVLHAFSPSAYDPSQARQTNSDGVWLTGDLVVSGNTIYGSASYGGEFGGGTVFKLNTDGTGFTVLKHFGFPKWDPESMTNIHTDGAVPLPGLVVVSNTLYGATTYGGQSSWGTLFKMNTDGTGFAVVKQFFLAYDPVSNSYTNSDGGTPKPGLALLGDAIYGMTVSGGHHGVGTLFKVSLADSSFTVLEQLDFEGHGLQGLTSSGSALYGTQLYGGDMRQGAVFRIDLTPSLSIGRTMSGDVAVSWPSVWTDYVLQQNGDGVSSLNWSNVTSNIQDDGTTRTLILNPTSGNRFYRLASP